MAEATNGGKWDDGHYADDHKALWMKRAQAAIDVLEAVPLQKRPVAFRVRAPWNDWMLFNSEKRAQSAAERQGVEYQGLYVRGPDSP